MHRTLLLAAALLAALAPSASAEEVAAEIRLFQFKPKEVRVKAGQAVAFTNRDAIQHSVTAEPQAGAAAFDTGLFGQDERRVITVSEPGEYMFQCARHASMRGKLIVE